MAKIEKTPNGFRVVHSITGAPLTGTFTGPGSMKRAQEAARKIRKRNR